MSSNYYLVASKNNNNSTLKAFGTVELPNYPGYIYAAFQSKMVEKVKIFCN